MELSIIIPVHNSENYIAQTLNSILEFSYAFLFEVILIDDNSTDRSLSIINNFCKKYSNVSVISLDKCSGVSNARNIGIDLSKGEYITFVDSDDEIISKTLNENFIDMLKNEYDILQFNYIEKNDKKMINRLFSKDNIVLKDKKSIIKSFICLEKQNINRAVWSKIFKKSCISNIRFDNNFAIGEDQKFIFDVLSSCNSIKLTNNFGYIYYIRSSSAMRTMNFNKSYQRIKVFDYIKNRVEGKELEEKCELEKLYILYEIYCNCIKSNDKEHIEQIYNEFVSNNSNIDYLNFKKKFLIKLLRKHRSFFNLIYRLIK